MNTRKTAIEGENAACEYLKKQGYEIVERNYSCPIGEIDVISRDRDGVVVFVEVKTLRREGVYRPGDNLSPRQMRRNFRAALRYYRAIGKPELRGRFDLVEVIASRWGIRSIRHRYDYLPPLESGGRRGRA